MVQFTKNTVNGGNMPPFKYHNSVSLFNLQVPRNPILWYSSAIGALSILFGKPDSKKSWLLLQLSHAICSGAQTFLDRPLNAKHKRVIYVSFEDNSVDIKGRLQTMGATQQQMNDFFLISTDTCPPGDILDTIEQIILTEGSVDLVVIDPLRILYSSGDPTNVGEVNMALNKLNHLAAKYQFSAIGIAHTTKGAVDWDMDKMKGVQEQAAMVRCVYLLNKEWLGVVKANHVKKDDRVYELKFDKQNCTWSGDLTNWEYKQNVTGTVLNTGKRRYHIDWTKVYGSDKKLSRSELHNRVQSMIPNISSRTIDQYMSLDLHSTSHGYFEVK